MLDDGSVVAGLVDESGLGPRERPDEVVLVSVSPAEPVLFVGGTALLRARAILANLTSDDATDLAAWSSSDPAVASVCSGPDSSGRLNALRPGMALAFARVGGKVGWTTVTVLQA